MTLLYHKDIYLPLVVYPDSTDALRLCYSDHALQAAKEDPFGDLTGLLPLWLFPEKWLLCEVEVIKGEVVKCLYEKNMANLRLSLVIRPINKQKQAWKVLTTWANRLDNRHEKADKSFYQKA